LKYWHENGDKVLIFSHSVKLLELLQYLFNNTSYTVSFLSGKTKNEERQKLVDSFNADPNQFVFLISTKAGGLCTLNTPPEPFANLCRGRSEYYQCQQSGHI